MARVYRCLWRGMGGGCVSPTSWRRRTASGSQLISKFEGLTRPPTRFETFAQHGPFHFAHLEDPKLERIFNWPKFVRAGGKPRMRRTGNIFPNDKPYRMSMSKTPLAIVFPRL